MEKLGAFIVPTGVGASIGGFAGDASVWARKFAKHSKLIVNPNVVNAGAFSGVTNNMLYVEGFMLDEFFKGKLSLKPSSDNKIGVVFDKAIPENVLNVHLNTINAVKTVYGIDIPFWAVTEEEVGVDFYINEAHASVGSIKNVETLKKSAQKLVNKGAEAIALVCLFDEPEVDNPSYANGVGVDPVGGVEAILSHYISRELNIPCAHSPAFLDFSICSDIVDAKSASEYITPTFLPCVLIGLSNAPKFNGQINIDNLDYLIMPYNCLGSVPVFEALKRKIKVFAVKENSTVLDVTNEKLHQSESIIVVDSYQQCLELLT